jgi:Na+-transporting NADH:ubiquinone oxidoreductase subunit C
MSANKDSIGRVFTVAIVLCVVSALFVAGSVVLLRPYQAANKLLDTQTNILSAAGLYGDGVDVRDVFAQRIDVRLVDLRTGELVADPATVGVADVVGYDQGVATRDPVRSEAIPAERDIAKLKRKPHFAKVYLIKNDTGAMDKIVLPVSGYGLWSTMYGYLVLGSDLNTVVGITFTEHGETPGLGGEVDNPKWKAQWPGKKLFDDAGNLVTHLKKGGINKDDPVDVAHNVDGLAGATLTSEGVNHLVKFWLGDDGFGPFLKKLKAQGA